MLNGNRGSKRPLVFSALLIHGDVGQLDPFVITKPGCMIDDMPCTDAEWIVFPACLPLCFHQKAQRRG